MGLRAAVYTRISLDRSGDALGVGRQETDCRQLVARNGWTVAEVYEDNDKSASGRVKRPRYEQMLHDMGQGHFDVVVVYHHDRLNRSPRELETYIDLSQRYGIDTHTIASGSYDLSTASGRGMARIAAAMARMEIDRQGERVKRKILERAQAGHPTATTRLFGYEPGNLVPRPSEALWVTKSYEKVLAGASILSIRAELVEAGCSSGRTGGAWNWLTVRRMLQRAHYAGIQVLNDQVVRDVTPLWQPIVEPELWHAVQAVLPARTACGPRGPDPKTFLTGLALCGVCGRKVGAHAMYVKHPEKAYYGCKPDSGDVRSPSAPSLGHPQRRMAPVDAYINEVVIARLSRPDVASALLRPRTQAPVVAAALAEIKMLEERLAEAAEAFAAGEIGRAQMATISERLSVQIAELTPRTAPDTRPNLLAGLVGTEEQVRERWFSLGMGARRDVVRALVQIELLPRVPGRWSVPFYPDEIRLTWL